MMTNPLKNKKGVVLGTVVVMSAIIMIMCSTITILTVYTHKLKVSERVTDEIELRLKNIGYSYLSGSIADADSDGIIDDTSYGYTEVINGNKKALFVYNASEKVLFIVSMLYDGEKWVMDGWYENASDVIREYITADCTNEGYIEDRIPNGLVYKSEALPALGHEYEEGVCTRCGAVES